MKKLSFAIAVLLTGLRNDASLSTPGLCKSTRRGGLSGATTGREHLCRTADLSATPDSRAAGATANAGGNSALSALSRCDLDGRLLGLAGQLGVGARSLGCAATTGLRMGESLL